MHVHARQGLAHGSMTVFTVAATECQGLDMRAPR